MKKSEHLSRAERNKLATDLEQEKEKIVTQKPQNLQERIVEGRKQDLAKTIEQDERNRRIRLYREYRKEPAFSRFVYGLRAFLSKVPAEELFHESMLSDLSSKIRKSSRNTILTSNNALSGEFIGTLYRAYIQAREFNQVLAALYNPQKGIELYIRYAFKHLYKDVQMSRQLSEIIDLEALQDKIQQGGEPFREYLLTQKNIIRRYCKNINSSFSSVTQGDLNGLYYLYLFSKFDYKKFFISLGGNLNTLKTGSFGDCPVTLALKVQLGNFYQYVILLRDLQNNLSKESAKYMFACAVSLNNNKDDIILSGIDLETRRETDFWLKKLANFSRNWTNVMCSYPFLELIRLASSNRFYELPKVTAPSLKIRDQIRRCIEQHILLELDIFVDENRNKLNADALQNMLFDYEKSMLEYYSHKSIVNTGRFQGIPGFSHVDQINIIYNFVTKYYVQNIKKVISHLVRYVLTKNSNSRNTLINASMAFDNLEQRIRNFNSDLGPDRPWGKSLMNIVYRLEKSDTGNLVRQIKDQLQEIDSEAQHLVEQGQNTFQNALNHLQTITATKNAKLFEMLGTVLPDSKLTLQTGIEKAAHALARIQTLVQSYYKGSL